MLGKLLKHEMMGSYRQYFVIFLVFTIGCIVVPMLPIGFDTKTFLGSIVLLISMVILMSISVNVIFNFYKSMFKRPGYLTLTLPASTKEIVTAKVIGGLIWYVIGILVMMMGVMVFLFVIGELGDFLYGLQNVFALISKIDGVFLELVRDFFTILCAVVFMILSVYFTITLTQTKYVPKYKAVVGIFGYFIVSLIIEYILLFQPIQNFLEQLSGMGMFVCANGFFVIGSVILFAGTVYLINNKIELE